MPRRQWPAQLAARRRGSLTAASAELGSPTATSQQPMIRADASFNLQAGSTSNLSLIQAKQREARRNPRLSPFQSGLTPLISPGGSIEIWRHAAGGPIKLFRYECSDGKL